MIVTFTGNPSVDLLFEADGLVWDDANRLPPPRRRPGGQGINVTRVARALGCPGTVAVAPLGGAAGAELRELLRREGMDLRPVAIDGETRVFVAVRETGTGRSLLLNPVGPTVGEADVYRMRESVLAALEGDARWLACCGSLPPGAPPDLYAELGRAARDRGVRFVPDCDGEPLRLALEAGCDLLVPNEHEAARLVGFTTDSPEAAGRAARVLRDRGVPTVAVTLGARGAVLAVREAVWFGAAPELPAGVAVGAGDAFLAALLLALERKAPPPDALRAAIGAGSAVLLGRGGALLDPGSARGLARVVEVREVP